MKIGIIQHGEEVAPKAREIIEGEIATAQVEVIDASDPFNALANAKNLLNEVDQMLMFVELVEEEERINTSFYDALAQLQVDTGKSIYKEIYLDTEEPDVEGTVRELVESTL